MLTTACLFTRRALLVLAALTIGCHAGNDPYQAALPTRAAVTIHVPGEAPAATTAFASGVRTEALVGAQATLYTMTREISTQLNGATESFFGMIDDVTATPPSGHDASHAYWGPFTPPLSPITVALAVERVDAQDYKFFLGGKPKGAPDSAYMGLLGGGAHQVDAQHGTGQLEVNFSTMHALDPTTNPATGVIGFVHSNIAAARTVDVHFADFDDGQAGTMPQNATYHYSEQADASGSFEFALKTNFDRDPNGILEDAALISRWLPTGAGRADMVVQGGSLPAGFVVHAIECWNAAFGRVYYTEDVDPTKTEGNASACAVQ
jgi:hypothetical protein